MKKIRNLKKKKKENYYENNNLKKQNQPHKIENRAFTMYWRKFSSESLLPPRGISILGEVRNVEI